MLLTKLEFSTQQENDRHVTNNVEYEETYAVEVKRFELYDTGVDKGSPRERTHEDSSPDKKHGVTNTEEVHRLEQYFAELEVWRFVEFDNTEVDIKFTQPWDYDISSSPAIKYEQTYTAEEA